MDLSPAKRALLEKWLKGETGPETNSIPRRPADSPIALSFPQQRQLFLEMLDRGTAVNNLSVLLGFRGKLDLAALEQSANQIMARHEALRTCFSLGVGLPVPEVATSCALAIPIVDLQGLPIPEQMAEARRLAEREVLQAFNLAQVPLIRLKLYALSEEQHLLLLVVHHTIADGWSLGVFLRELLTAYQAIASGRHPVLPELTIQYADFAHWQTDRAREAALRSSLTYWKEQLAGELPVLELPTDQPRGVRQTFSGGTHRFTLPQKLTQAVEDLGRQEDATLFMTLLAAFGVLLNRYSGQDDILVGTPVANRNRPELETLIGVFINTLVLRTDLSGEPGFRELLRRVRDVSRNAFAHQDLPFEQLVEALNPERDLSRTPLFQVVFNMQNAPMPEMNIPGLEMRFLEIDRGVSQFDLSLMMSRTEGQWQGIVEYNDQLFQPETIERMFRSFLMLLEDAVARPDRPVSRLRIVSEEELRPLVYELNQTQLDFPREKCVQELFEAQVERTPDAVALRYGPHSRTYRELNQRANALARHLRGLGVGPACRVAIRLKRSFEMVEALLAVLKTGGAYVPLHISYPEERVAFMLKDAGAKVLLTHADLEPLEGMEVQIVHLEENASFPKGPDPNLPVSVTPGDLAYVIYTSGSTGQPKGVMVPHSALVNFLWSMSREPGMRPEDVLLAVTSVSFDIAVLELFLPLLRGAEVVIASEEMTTNPYLIGEAIRERGVSVMQATPATWQLLLESGWTGEPGLKALCGGDVLTRKLADQLLERVGSLWNMYGPTETTVWSSICLVCKGDAPITIGRPIGNTELYVLDRHLQALPIGVLGELHIGGEGVTRGYLNRSALTGEKFIADPFRSKSGARLYKTGDRARYLPDRSIELLGRMDDQVKINGYRIELGEVAAVLTQHPSVQEAIAIARTERSGEKRLVAYYVPKQGQSPEAEDMRGFIRQKLPVYMTPVVYIRLESIPLTPNGKTDRKALPVPEDIRQLPGYVAPRNKEEQILASIWQDVLEVEQVGIHDNFFDLGGASMQSLQIVARANISGLRFDVDAIFEHQTIAELVAEVKGEKKTDGSSS